VDRGVGIGRALNWRGPFAIEPREARSNIEVAMRGIDIVVEL
jgi:hypothetical protein